MSYQTCIQYSDTALSYSNVNSAFSIQLLILSNATEIIIQDSIGFALPQEHDSPRIG